MKRMKYVAFALLVAGCSDADETVLDYQLPPGVARIDGDVEGDHIFFDEQQRASYCAASPDSPACLELGTAEQPFRAAEYHGQDDNGNSDIPCYANDSDGGNCRFPRRKRMNYVFDTTNCFPTLVDGNHDSVSALQGSALRAGFENGFRRWNGIANGVSVEANACTTGPCITVNVTCANLTTATSSPFAVGGLTGAATTVFANLPRGPNGRIDQAAAQTQNSAIITIDPGKILDFYVESCGDGTPTRGELSDFARHIGVHEMGHVFAFEHFDSLGDVSVMFPFTGCEDIADPVIDTPFAQALGTFDPTNDGSATILDHNLENEGP
jgi:hypothetical protein